MTGDPSSMVGPVKHPPRKVPKDVGKKGLEKARAALEEATGRKPTERVLPEAELPAVQCVHPAWNRRGQSRVCASCGTEEELEQADGQ